MSVAAKLGPIRRAGGFIGRIPGDASYTYLHRKADSGEPFYVGKGRGDRAWLRARRSAHWQSIVAKHGLVVEIVTMFDSDADAMLHERALISAAHAAGVRLANHTSGGEGAPGMRHTDATKARISAMKKGLPAHPATAAALLAAARQPKSAEHRAKIKAANLGKKRSQAQIDAYLPALRAAMADPAVRAKISAAAAGRKRATNGESK
ncbi:MAG TPA: NUMOD3 domain-containing DNA-binding protein [Rubrivivax sp.]|nr:NUMOD3 domain-containing DNA-binding protein [Rubrivivax sp.]HRY86509.1 NUMOD3 domain-containing DNA-binding protein [Rubrivivax sp.]